MSSEPPVLVINCGSSSLKAALIAADGTHVLDRTLAEAPHATDTGAQVNALVDALAAQGRLAGGLAGVGYRVVHGGTLYTAPTLIDAAVEAGIASLAPLSPLHNPQALAAIRAGRERLPDVGHVAVFDTAFFATLPRRAYEYALPAAVSARHGIRRFGFHGTSHAFVAAEAAAWLGTDLRRLRLVTCHLGSGASVAAIEAGRGVETSMGYTPLEGLVMATRGGDLDPGILLELLRAGETPAALERMLDEQSGLVGLTGSADMREVERRAAAGDDACRLAIQISAHRVRKYIGAYAAVMGDVDAIVFTGGVGEGSALMRHRIAQRLGFLGAVLDEDRNRDARVDTLHRVAEISEPRARCRLLVVATDEEVAIAAATRELLGRSRAPPPPHRIPVAVSVRHVHLSAETVGRLFGAGRKLTPKTPLSQPGQFAAEETVTLVGPRGRIEHVRVVGPERGADQVEVARTDEFVLGIDAPVRESGDLGHTPGIRLDGPAGTVTLREGVICALRHLHMTPADAALLGVADGDDVEVRIDGGVRPISYGDVRVRVRGDFRLELHVDTDEGNAAGLAPGASGVLVGRRGSAPRPAAAPAG
jgi:acetate kinase